MNSAKVRVLFGTAKPNAGLLFALLFLTASLPAADWVRAGVNTNQPLWGLRGGLQFALPPGGFTWGDGGPRGLIRIGYPTLTNGGYDLINFIAIEPVVKNRRGFSELEHSAIDGKQGRLLAAGEMMQTNVSGPILHSGELKTRSNGVEELIVPVRVEKFGNGAHVRLILSQRSDAPDELRLRVYAEPDSAPMERCILTATMGNKARTRLLWLMEGPVSSLNLYGDYRGSDFAAHEFFKLPRLPRAANGDVLVAITTDEANPADGNAGLPRFWQYRGAKVTQYWRKPAKEVRPELQGVVNARFTYWMSARPLPGGIAFENFELQESFQDGQTFIFGVTKQAPAELF